MTGLPPACPSYGTGTSKSYVYTFSHLVTSCWRCQRTLPEVRRAVQEIREKKAGKYPPDRVGNPALLVGADYDEIVEVGLAAGLGLCGDCHGAMVALDYWSVQGFMSADEVRKEMGL